MSGNITSIGQGRVNPSGPADKCRHGLFNPGPANKPNPACSLCEVLNLPERRAVEPVDVAAVEDEEAMR